MALSIKFSGGNGPRGRTVLLLYALVVFLLYLPAAGAGFVSDYTGWLQSLREHSFADYLNRSHFGVKSLYQVTQFNTWLLYQVLGTSKWGWHLLFVALHTANALLVFLLLRRLFRHARFADAGPVAFLGGLLFAVSPYCSEVVVWEPSFHYLQALLLLLPILILCLRQLEGAKSRYPVLACGLYLVSTFTHELFYLTPALATLLLLWHRFALDWNRESLRRCFLRFVLPLWGIFALHLLLFYLVYGARISHVGTSLFENPWQSYAIKAPFYYYHVGVWGRFWPNEWKLKAYALLRTPAATAVFYALLLSSLLLPVLFFRKMRLRGRTAFLLYAAFFGVLLLFVPMWFPDLLLVVGDRYTYLMLVFWSGLLAVVVSLFRWQWLGIRWLIETGRSLRAGKQSPKPEKGSRPPLKGDERGMFPESSTAGAHLPPVPLQRGMTARPSFVRIVLAAALVLINAGLTLKTNLLWRQSAHTVDLVQHGMRPLRGKIGLFVNVPASLKGIPMIGYSREGEVRLMHNLLYQPYLSDSLLDVSSYNMNTPADGAHVEVVNDSTLRVTLNQWGTWWWMGGYGAVSYETPYFRVDMTDQGHWYDLILRDRPERFEIYYQVGDRVKTVDWNRKGEQD